MKSLTLLFLAIMPSSAWGWDDRLNGLEDLVVQDLYVGAMRNVWTTLHIDGEELPSHYLEPVQRNDSLPDMVLIHGYGATSALAWRGVIPRLGHLFNVYAIDIPGLGRTIPHSKLLSADTAENTQDLICHFFNELYSHIGLDRPYVVAHSLGAYMFIHCIEEYPRLASRITAADAPGFFPSSGGFDYLWASFFVIGIPHAPIQMLGSFGNYMVSWGSALVGLDVASFYVDYWHGIQSNPVMKAHKIVQKFIDHNYLYAHGVGSPLLSLLKLTIPVATLYGSEDNISPAHQGEIIEELSGIKQYRIDGADHVSYRLNDAKDFVEAVLDIYRDAQPPAVWAPRVSDCLKERQELWTIYPCVPSYLASNYLMRQMYATLRTIKEECLLDESSLRDSNSQGDEL
jgi:pimeloyl-ACP methyl ester carboxylesterase